MKKIILLCTLLYIALTGFGQTTITIIATVHNKTKYITADTIYAAVNSFKPDLILLELDTSLMDDEGNFKKIDPNSNEMQVALRYKKEHSNVLLRRFDVDYRNQYYKDHKTFVQENNMFKPIDSLFRNNALNDTSWFIVSSLYAANQAMNNMGYMRLKDINSQYFMSLASFRQNWLYKKVLGLIKNNPGLNQWYSFFKDDADFWEMRNATMVKNIAAFARKYTNKSIVVMVGNYHKYALIDSLKPLEKEGHFLLNAYSSQ